MGKSRDWAEPLTETLQELTDLSGALDHICEQPQAAAAVVVEGSSARKKKRSSSSGDLSTASSANNSGAPASINQELKLAASLFLCCGTIVKAVGPRPCSS